MVTRTYSGTRVVYAGIFLLCLLFGYHVFNGGHLKAVFNLESIGFTFLSGLLVFGLSRVLKSDQSYGDKLGFFTTGVQLFGLIGASLGIGQMIRVMDDPSKLGPAAAFSILTLMYATIIAMIGHIAYASASAESKPSVHASTSMTKKVLSNSVLLIMLGAAVAFSCRMFGDSVGGISILHLVSTLVLFASGAYVALVFVFGFDNAVRELKSVVFGGPSAFEDQQRFLSLLGQTAVSIGLLGTCFGIITMLSTCLILQGLAQPCSPHPRR